MLIKKNATPKQVARITSIVVSLFILLVLVIIKLLFPTSINWILVCLVPVFLFLSSAIIFYRSIENFIYRRIKLIYKIIYETKSSSDIKPSRPRIEKDIIKNIESEVIEWKKTKLINSLKEKKLAKFRKEFLGNVFHELKTPIFNIQGYLETVIDDGRKDENINIQFLEKANKNVNRITEIVDDLQMIANLSEGSFLISEEKFNITRLVSEVIDTMEMQANKKKISIEIKEGCNKSYFVKADRDLILQVLTNLTTNSIKYGKENGKTQIGFYDMNEKLLVEVTDNGIGIEKKHLPRIFERFYRVDKNRSREQGGSGLGLSIVKHIVESHGQSINVRSTPGVGSTFGFTLKKVQYTK